MIKINFEKPLYYYEVAIKCNSCGSEQIDKIYSNHTYEKLLDTYYKDKTVYLKFMDRVHAIKSDK